jgi:3'-phosphoadenosine 5'-phosphosulfate sulfotransferase (PAPS reductase)/FAD synthetase
LGAHVIFADTGKQFPEMAQSISEIEAALGLAVETVPRRITFDEFLFERGGMLPQGNKRLLSPHETLEPHALHKVF